MIRNLVVLSLALISSGCVSFSGEFGTPIPREEDVEDITASSGPILDDVYTYRFIQNDSTLWFVPILFASVEARASSETLTVFFDEQGRVRYHAFRRDDAPQGAPR